MIRVVMTMPPRPVPMSGPVPVTVPVPVPVTVPVPVWVPVPGPSAPRRALRSRPVCLPLAP